jgi:inositol transport system ATP-binding protein
MDEIYEIADRVTVLRDGQYIDTMAVESLNKNTLVSLMVGRAIENLYPTTIAKTGKAVLSVRNLTQKGKFSNISFDLHKGEVLGIAGLMGAGRSEIARAIYGLDKYDSGDIFIEDQKITIHSPKEAIKNGIGYVSEDRKGWGFVPKLSIKHNISLTHLPNYHGWILSQNEEEITDKMAKNLKIKALNNQQQVTYLSGGNQQKVVIAKMLLASPKIVILDEPTRGVDVGAKFEIYTLIRQLTNRGISVIMISSELPEILGMSDRVLVLSKGKQTALLSHQEATQETIMHYAIH